MSSLEKRHTSRRGSMQGHRKYSNGFSDTSSVGSFMDETDREVSNLTDRAFRSLCIGEEAIYNDSEISSPTERHKAFAKEVPQKDALQGTCQEAFSYGIQYREAERRSEVTSTFQHSYVDVAQEQVLRDEHISYMSNGCMEATWQQRRSTSRVSSLIKAFSSKEGYCDGGTPDSILLRDKYRDFNSESWDKSALLSIQRELFSSAYHQNFKSGPFQSYRNHFHASNQMDTTASLVKSSNIKFHALNSTNFFFHSEFSPFQLWKDYNRFAFDSEKPSGFVSASEFPRWYDSPMYKELTAPHTFESESRRFNRRKIEDVIPNQRSRSTVIQKASAIEKRCESETASNCPPWRRNYNFVRSKLPSNRPSTVSPTNEKMHRPDSSLLSQNRHVYDIHPKAEKVGGIESSSSTPFNITQLLTPVIHGRQETETSEILQFAHTPTVPDHFVQGDIDLKPISDAKQLRDSYKSKASSLLFNLKDNRKRVKSTYSPSKFKGLEMTDQNQQPIKLEDLESQTLSDTVVTQENSAVPYSWELGDVAQQTYDVCLPQTVEHKEYADGLHDNMTSVPHYGASNYKIFHEGSQSSSLHPDKLLNKESVEYEFSAQMLSAHKSTGDSEGHIYGPSRIFNPTRPEIENVLPKVHPPAHSLLAQMSEKQTFSKREDMGYHDLKERQKTVFEYTKNQVIEEKLPWQNPGSINTTNTEMLNSNAIKGSLPFKGEIAALIEMDKQRKATAKQYLPSANYGYTTEKEKYINKVNENIKQGRLTKEEEIQDRDGSSLKYPYINKLAQYNSTDMSSTSQNLYGSRSAQNDSVQRMTSFPSKESSLSRTSEIRRTTHDKVCFQRDVKYATSDSHAENDYSQKIQCSTSLEEKHQKNEGSVAYQPYKYEPNKQWHIAATERRHGMDEVPVLTQLQAERGPKEIYQTKQGDMMTDIRKLNIQSTEPNNSSRTREDKFSINDILSIRDNEQAKRVKENKHSLTAGAGDFIKLENQAPSIISHTAEEKAPKIDAFKEKQTTKDKHENGNMLYGYIRKESHKPNEGLANTGTFNKDKSGKETVVGKENDKIIPRTLSYKERGQTKQEILTSKLKAHAQKEISAIKEKGLAKQNILSRNPMKQSMAVNNEKGQMSQEVVSPKKEITAEKLNHLFQDITYSSVTLYKENRYQDKDGPKYEPLTAEEIKLPTSAIGPQAEVALSEKNNEVVKDVKFTANEKERTKVQPLTQRIQTQDEKTTVVEKKTCEPQSEFNVKSSTEYQREQSVNGNLNHETLPAKGLSSYPVINSSNEEASGVKAEEQMASNLPVVYSSDPTENPAFTEKKKDSPKYDIFGKTTTSSLTSYNDSEQTKLLDHFVNKTEQPLVKVDQLTTNLKHPDLMETIKLPVQNPHHESQSSVKREKLIKKPKEKEAGISSNGIKSPLDLKRLKDETLPVILTVHSTDTKTLLPAKHKTNSTKEDQLKKGDDINPDEVPSSRNIKLPKSSETNKKDNPELCAKQDKVQEDNTSKTNEDSNVQQLHTDTPVVKTFESASRNKENQTSNSSMEAKSELDSAEVNECSLLKDLKQTKDENLHSQKDETQQVSQSKQEIGSANYDNPMVRTNAGSKSNSQQLQQDSDRLPDLKNQTQREKDLFEQTENISKEIKQSEDKITVNRNNSGSAESEKSPEESNTVNVTIENNGEQMTSQTVQNKSSQIINPAPESHIIHLPNKEDSAPADEPVIYSIRVSSKSDAVSEDEPIIYTICVSSISDNSMTDVPESQDKSSFAPKQLSTEGAEKEEETSGNKNEEIHTDCADSKASDNKEAKRFFSSDETEKQTMNSPATKDKQDYYRSSEVNNITSSYESLLAKYGLPIREKEHPKPQSKEQDKIKQKDDEESANSLSENVQKNSVDDDCASTETISAKVLGGHCQESRNAKPQEEFTELSKEGKVNKQYTTHSMTTDRELTQKAVGVVINSENHKQNVKQHTSENSRPLPGQGIKANQKALMSKVVESWEGSQDIQPGKASKHNTRNDVVELKGNMQVRQKVQATDFKREKAQKENEHDNVFSKKAETVPGKHENENQKSNPVAGISFENVISTTTVIDNHSHEDSLQYNSKSAIPKTVTENSKIKESIDKEVSQTHFCNRAQKGDHLYKCKQDKSPVPNSQKAISEAVNPVIPELVSKDPAPTKDSKPSQNRKEFVWKNAFSGQEQDKFKTSDEIKDKRELGITASSKKQIENSRAKEDLLKKALNRIKMDPCLFKSPNITLEDKKVTKNEHQVNKDIFTVQDKLTGQQEQTKTDSVKAKDDVLSKNTISQNVESLKATGQKTLSIVSTEEDSKRLNVQKGKGEVAQVQKENVKGEITPVNKDNSKKALNLFKDEKDTERESKKDGINLKEGIAQPPYKKDENTIDKVRKDDGQAKSMFGAMVVKDSSDSVRKEMALSAEALQAKHEDRTNVYQYHPGKGFLPETKGNVGSSHHDTMLKQTEGTSTVLHKSEVMQKDKKTRPEISALADYARLRVISAEDDSTNEEDLLQKMDTNHKYNLTAVEPHKGNLPVSVGGTEPKTELTVNKKHDYQSLATKPLPGHERDQPLFQRDKFTKGVLEEHNQCTPKEENIAHPKLSSLAKRSDDQIFAIKETRITKEKILTNQMKSNTKTSLTEQHYGYRRSHEIHQSQNLQVQNTMLSQVEGKNNGSSMLQQSVHAELLEKDIKNPRKKQESLPQMSVGTMLNKVNQQADNQKNVQPEINQEEKGEELEYFTVRTMENDSKPEETHETFPFSNKIVSKKALTDIPTTRPRSNSCSPAMGKPTMFRVKDNTIRTSSATKAVKPHFHRSFSEEFRIASTKEVWNSSEKSELECDRELEHDRELNTKEPENSPVLHEPMVASHRLTRMREIQSQNSLSSSEFTAAKGQRSYFRRSQVFEDDETQSVISTMSEDVESVAESSIVTTDNTASRGYEMKSNRDTYVRPESACYVRPESACYERPESACYERPESACSDLRSLGKPPTVPPKTEKALRRAKKLTTRRIKKAETKMTSDNQEQLETKSTRAVSSLPSSPMELVSTNHTVHASPAISTYHVEPNYAPTAPSLVAHPFPMTQRKLLQDPNSGQYFMVDMPVQVKTKTFFDPETGKYVQLNVRQRTQNNHPQPQSVKVLNPPYVVYPGFLPMSVSSLPLRSSSQMSAPATLVDEQNKLEACREPWKQETYQPNYHRNTRQNNNPEHGTHEISGDDSLYAGNSANITQRHTDIITMSELEDFAMEST